MLANPLCMLFKINLVKDYIPLVFSYVPCKRNGKMLGMTNDSEAFSLLVSNVMSSKSSSFALFWASSSNLCLAALDLRADVEQPFSCLIILNRQAMESMRRSMGWRLEDNMVDGLFFCATLTGCRGGHTPFEQTWTETSDTVAEAVKPDPVFSWECHSGWVGVSVEDANV